MLISDYDKRLMSDASKYFGSFINDDGCLFRVYAPGAKRVFVIGSFNDFSEVDELKKIDNAYFEGTIKNAKKNDMYKYIIYDINNHRLEKTDPYARFYELRPGSCAIITDSIFQFNDDLWMKSRTKCFDSCLNIYEMHLGSWLKNRNYRTVAKELVDYLIKLNYSHVEFLPLSEHPFDGSWGYQSYGYFAPTSRYGHMDDLKYLINELHNNGIGVICDYVLVHFVKDSYGLGNFDGNYLYEYKDEYNRESEWDTLNFDLMSQSVRNFLLSSLCYFIDEFHFDGVRIDALSNLIYWGGNKERGINNDALEFVRDINDQIHMLFNDQVMMIAEDSTDFPMVTKSREFGGLGFDYKWCLGWMNDTLKYFAADPVYRASLHHNLTFSMMYNYSENFILPLSHDEVVHGKKSIVSKMYGLYEERFASARALYTYMYMHPGHKLNFMGNEIGQMIEFDESRELDWFLLDYPMHQKFNQFMIDLNTLYKEETTLSAKNFDHYSFKWINANKEGDNVYLFSRQDKENYFVYVLNMSRNYYENYGIGVDFRGEYLELINTDDLKYGGFGVYNGEVLTKDLPCDNLEQAIFVKIAPMSGIIFRLTKLENKSEKVEICLQQKKNL